jgi:hypothetical protein
MSLLRIVCGNATHAKCYAARMQRCEFERQVNAPFELTACHAPLLDPCSGPKETATP